MNTNIINYFIKFNLFSKNQHGFIPTRSTNTALFNFLAEIYKCVDQGFPCLSVLIDLSKAFDCVNHSILLYKLERYGINGTTLSWFQSYLRNRELKTVCHNIHSNKSSINIGVPQGSVLGPTLFLIYINDFPSYITATDSLILYADDINITIKSSDTSTLFSKINHIFTSVTTWININRLILNPSKTQFILFKNKAKYNLSTFLLNGERVGLAECSKVLGVFIDEHLKWTSHVDELCNSLSRTCYAIYNLKRSCSFSVVKNFYYSNFQSRMAYGIIHWGMCSDSNRVFTIQKRALRSMIGLTSRHSCKNVFKSHKILTFYDIYILEVLCFVHRNYNTFFNGVTHDHHTRNLGYLLPPCHKTTTYQKYLIFMGCKLFNHLPSTIKKISNFYKFRKTVKHNLLHINCYNLDDYFSANLC